MYKWLFPFFIFLNLVPFISQKSIASTLFAPDGDTALLFQLVTNTATQINELEQLLTNAQKHTEIFEKYNQIAKDHYFRAQRINYIAQSYVELSQNDPRDLEGLNSAIRSLKSETDSLKSLISEYRTEEAINEKHEKQLERKAQQSQKEVSFANYQLHRTGTISSSTDAVKLTAQNTALSYKAHVEGNQIHQVVATKLAEQNKLMARTLKDAKREELKREEYYNLSDKDSLRRRSELGGSK
jgi:hypothetical protein